MTDLKFVCPAPMLSVVSRLAPLAFEVFALVFDLNEGLNASPAQLLTWNGLDRFCVAPARAGNVGVPVSVDSVANAPQLVGLIR